MNTLYLLKELLVFKKRVFLTIFSIVWATMTMTLLLSFGHGFKEASLATFKAISKNLLFVQGGLVSQPHAGWQIGDTVDFLPKDLAAFKKIPGLVALSPISKQNSSISILNYSDAVNINYVGDAYPRINDLNIEAGRFFHNREQNVAVLSENWANTLHASPLGKAIIIGGIRYTVIGLLANQSKGDDTEQSEEIFLPLDLHLLLVPIQSIIFYFDDHKSIQLAQQEIFRIMVFNHHIASSDTTALIFQSNQEKVHTKKIFLNSVELFLSLISSITLLMTIVALAYLLYSSIKRETPSIGLRMALGETTWSIMRYYVLSAVALTFVSGLVGIVIAYLVIFLINLFLPYVQIFGINHMTLTLSPILLLIILFMLVSTSFIFSLIPARLVAKIKPVEALIYV